MVDEEQGHDILSLPGQVTTEPADEQKLTDWLNVRLAGGDIKLLLDCR